jgi:hypothetical protein
MTRTRISWPYRWGSKPFPSSFIFLENSPLPAKSSNTWKTFESALALPSNTRIMTLHMDFQELSTTRCICPCPRLIPTFIFWRFECWVQGTSGGASNQFSNVRGALKRIYIYIYFTYRCNYFISSSHFLSFTDIVLNNIQYISL